MRKRKYNPQMQPFIKSCCAGRDFCHHLDFINPLNWITGKYQNEAPKGEHFVSAEKTDFNHRGRRFRRDKKDGDSMQLVDAVYTTVNSTNIYTVRSINTSPVPALYSATT